MNILISIEQPLYGLKNRGAIIVRIRHRRLRRKQRGYDKRSNDFFRRQDPLRTAEVNK